MIYPLSIQDLTVAYNGRPILWDIDCEIPNNKLVAIVGPNGAGKSTLIKSCLGIVKPLTGDITFYGEHLKKVLNRVAYVPQRESVDWEFPVSVLDVVLMGLYGKIGWIRRIKDIHKKEAKNALELVGLSGYEERHISQLSGGQQQRVFLARALVQNADLYLMDEPFAGVDAATEKSIITVLKNLQKEGKTIVCVHHHLQTVNEYFDYTILLNGRIVAEGPVSEVFNEENLKITYGGKLTLLEKAASHLSIDNIDL